MFFWRSEEDRQAFIDGCIEGQEDDLRQEREHEGWWLADIKRVKRELAADREKYRDDPEELRWYVRFHKDRIKSKQEDIEYIRGRIETGEKRLADLSAMRRPKPVKPELTVITGGKA